MDDQFRNIYQLLFDNYQISNELPVERGGLGLPPISATIREFVNTADRAIALRQKHLRPDSKYFLLINFYSMVFMPLVFGSRNLIPDEIMNAIASDIEQIAENAATETQGEEVSGHEVLNAIAKEWPDLKTTRFRLWGDK